MKYRPKKKLDPDCVILLKLKLHNTNKRYIATHFHDRTPSSIYDLTRKAKRYFGEKNWCSIYCSAFTQNHLLKEDYIIDEVDQVAIKFSKKIAQHIHNDAHLPLIEAPIKRLLVAYIRYIENSSAKKLKSVFAKGTSMFDSLKSVTSFVNDQYLGERNIYQCTYNQSITKKKRKKIQKALKLEIWFNVLRTFSRANLLETKSNAINISFVTDQIIASSYDSNERPIPENKRECEIYYILRKMAANKEFSFMQPVMTEPVGNLEITDTQHQLQA